VNWVWNHTLNKIKLTCWVLFCLNKNFCRHTEPWSNSMNLHL
jgi:hypothetical protein